MGRGIDSGDRVLPALGDPGGTVGSYDHAMGRRARPQRDQIRLAGPGIEPAEFARRLRSEPHCTIRCRIDVVRPSPASTGKVRISILACVVGPAANITSIPA